ncbi:MAG: hypothetical protein MUO76_16960 [Anaerolineaceae bacterium]|nr:hypothetical protein [Anaerolineaceae bacterium]
MNLFGKKKKNFPPLPEWKPSVIPPAEDIIKTFTYYANGKKDFVIFINGTITIVDDGLDDESAIKNAKKILCEVYNYHPDMNPRKMDDGNILISYNHPAYNIVLESFAQEHWKDIEANHIKALCTDEVILTPLGPNKFDDFGKKALWGRCYFFMDAQNPEVLKIVRKSAYKACT